MNNTSIYELKTFDWDVKRGDEFKNTLQVFITDDCNIRCRGCFIDKGYGLSGTYMSMDKYKAIIDNESGIEKVVLLGGEPTLHPGIVDMCIYNNERKIETTVYTNGTVDIVLPDFVNIRVSVSGVNFGAKPMSKVVIKKHGIFSVRLGIEQGNKREVLEFAKAVEEKFGGDTPILFCRHKRIDKTHSYDIDTSQCVSGKEYISIIESFLKTYAGNIKEVHVTKQGYITNDTSSTRSCRFSNVLVDGTRVTCPLDLGLLNKPGFDIMSECSEYGRPCNKNNECLLQKVVLIKH